MSTNLRLLLGAHATAGCIRCGPADLAKGIPFPFSLASTHLKAGVVLRKKCVNREVEPWPVGFIGPGTKGVPMVFTHYVSPEGEFFRDRRKSEPASVNDEKDNRPRGAQVLSSAQGQEPEHSRPTVKSYENNRVELS